MVKAARLIAVSLVGVGLVSACGFQPLYGGPGYTALPGIAITAENDRVGYLVEDALRDHFGEGRSPYSLELQTEYRVSPLGLSAAGRASRFSAEMRVSYLLTGPEEFRHSGRVAEAVFYDAPSDPYALIAARAAAEERAAERVAEQLALELATALQRTERGLEP